MREDWDEIVEIPEKEGIFRLRYHRLSLRAIRNLRGRLSSQVWDLRRQITSHYDQIAFLKRELAEKEKMLEQLSDAKIKSWTKMEEGKRQESEDRALNLLQDVIGPKYFKELEDKGSFQFKGFDGETYRIKKDGTLQVQQGNYWVNKCVLRPDIPDLPLPDFIASTFIGTTQDPIFLKRSLTQRHRREVIT
ncbi:MAG: hypothetical protein OEZ48_00260 [Candidatus Bathyarchaeota archaeon]|nr:hypothetical protein [Candidatus Bathyarchaeota archaeon]MDH5686289.1 hypothetical protein [Candidatus Bathyarchaeota archaeon]